MKRNSLLFKYKLGLIPIITLIVASLKVSTVEAQIYEPEGLNMPGTYNGYVNPPTNLVFANPSQSSGGKLSKISTGTLRWQTSFSVAASGGDVVGGTYTWLFTSGPTSNYYANKWAGVNVSMNTMQTYTHNSGADNTITLVNGKWYTMNWKDSGYGNTSAIFIETDGQPVTVQSTSRVPSTVYSYQKPIIYATVSGALPDGQGVYIRYTNDAWASSSVIQMASFEGNIYKAELPPYANGTSVQYYIFTSRIGLTIPPAEADLYTINLLNNSGSNYTYNVQSGTVRFTTVNGNWSSTGTWEGGIKPISTDQVVIQHNVVYDETSTTTVSGLLINQNCQLTINSTQSITVNNELANNGTLLIKSNSSGTGSLKHSTAGVAATFERNFDDADWTNPTDGWHYLSSPVAAQAISPGFVTDPISNYDMYVWYEPENLWVNHKNTSTAPTWATANVINNGQSNNTDNFLVGKGYLVAYNNGGVKEFSGTLNVSDVNISGLTITGSTNANRSWHLLGNPFSCALTWDGTAAWNLSNISGVAKIWDESSRALVDLTSSSASIIPATNGFLVQVSSGPGSLTIPASKRDHSSLDFYKSGASTSRFLLTASTFDGESAQQSNLFVNPEATEVFDLLFDSEFLAGYAPQFYSIAGDIKLSTNTLPSLPDDAIIPFGFVKNEATQFNITMQEQISGYIVYLNDLLTGVEHNLTDQPVYSFTSAEGDDPNRFLLYFAPVSVNKPAQGNAYGIYSYAGQVHVSNTPSNAQITLSTLIGQVVMQRNAGGSGLVTLNAASLPKGVYIVTVQGEGARVSRKVVL